VYKRQEITAVEKDEDHSRVRCEVLCQNQNSEPVLTGVAEVKVKAVT